MGPVWHTEFAEIKNPQKAQEGYDPAEMKRLVRDYEELAATLPPKLRAGAYDTVAHYRARFGETDKARRLYTFIVSEVPDYENVAKVREALASLK